MTVAAHREVERKYELPDGAEARIDWSGLEGYTVTDTAVEHRMEAVYCDTADMALDRHQVALRRRKGGADDGWHVKLREAGGRHEARFPLLGGAPERMPAAVRRLLAGLTGGHPMVPIATLRTHRRVLMITDASEAPVAELAIDEVEAVDERSGTRGSWSEWEVELIDGAVTEDHQHHVFTAVEQALFAAGGKASTPQAKITRALGLEDGNEGDEVPAPAENSGQKNGKEPGTKATGADVLLTVPGELAEQLVLWDLKVRLDVPDAVHQMRVTSRSMRSLLKAAAPFFDGGTAAELDARLRELARALSEARDAEVTAELLPGRAAAFEDMVAEADAQALQRTAEQQAETAAATVRDHVAKKKHLVLLADVQAFAANPPLTERCEQLPARKVATKLLRRTLRKVHRAGQRGVATQDSGAEADLAHRMEHLHEVRKDIKRVRYVDAVLKRSGFTPGKSVRRAAADAKKYQESLGKIMDAGVVKGWLARTAQASQGTGEDRYAVGVLHGAEAVTVRTGIEDGHEIVTELLARLRQDLT